MDTKEYAANRIVQIDSRLLDKDLIKIFGGKFNKIAELLLKSRRSHRLYEELRKIALYIYYFSQIFGDKTPGQNLMNICVYRRKRLNVLLHLLLSTSFTVALRIYTSLTTNNRMHKWVEKCVALLAIFEFIHVLFFLNRGGPVTIQQRIFKLCYTHQTPPKLGVINYHGLNRELLGHCFGHLCILLVPLYTLVQHKIKSTFFNDASKISTNTIDSDSPLICKKCEQTAILPMKAFNKENKVVLLCYYCYHLCPDELSSPTFMTHSS